MKDQQMNASLLIGIALGLTFAVLVVRPPAPQQMALMGTSAVLFLASALLEGKWLQFACQIVGVVVVLLLARWVNWSSKQGETMGHPELREVPQHKRERQPVSAAGNTA